MDKRGQFYLIAAIIIVVIMVGIVTIVNYASSKPSLKSIESMSSDLSEEGPRIIDYGIYSKEDISETLRDFTAGEFAPYFLKTTDNSNVVFIYGNSSGLSAVKYNLESKGTISATVGGATEWKTAGPYAEDITLTPSGNKVEINIIGKSYEFELRENEMFYFVMIQQKEGETYVEKN